MVNIVVKFFFFDVLVNNWFFSSLLDDIFFDGVVEVEKIGQDINVFYLVEFNWAYYQEEWV